jgi:hypothetical protein
MWKWMNWSGVVDSKGWKEVHSVDHKDAMFTHLFRQEGDFTLRSYNSREMGPTSLSMQVQLSSLSTYVITAISVEYHSAAECNGLNVIPQRLSFKTSVVHEKKKKTLDESLLTYFVC